MDTNPCPGCLWPRTLLSVLALLGAGGGLAAGELRLDAMTLLTRSASSDVGPSPDGRAVVLERGVVVEDDGPAAGYSYLPSVEKLSETVWIRKELVVADPRAARATLLVGPGGDLRARVNGRPADIRPAGGKLGGYWQAWTLPAGLLRQGSNEIVLSGSGQVWIARDEDYAAGSRERTRHPNRSAKSSDAGRSWDDKHLGANGTIDGEYYVRLFLDQHRPSGMLTLPVLDLGSLDGAAVAPPLKALAPVQVRLDAETGEAGRVRVQARSGTTFAPGEETWSAWEDISSSLASPRGRFFQLRLELTTADARHTPRLRGLTLSSTPTPAGDWHRALRVRAEGNEPVVRSGIPFTYEPMDHPRLALLRQRFRLDEVVKGATSEMDLIARLAAWSSRQWAKGHLGKGYPPWDALEILAPHADGTPVGGFCQQYNLVFLQACESFGLIGRCVSLGPGDHGVKIRGGHEVVEVWSSEHRKWVYVDGNAAWYFVDKKDRQPLSLLELRGRQLSALAGRPFPEVELVELAPSRYTWTGLTAWPPFVELRLIPRSDFLARKAPLPLHQGMRGWFWTGHHVWTDAAAPASLLYGRRVSQERNWSWTLNQAHVSLEAAGPGVLRVHLDTQTPGLDTFLARLDGGKEEPVEPVFTWKLRPGVNRLEVRPRNIAGRTGTASSLVVEQP